jgi:hypothetical protein
MQQNHRRNVLVGPAEGKGPLGRNGRVWEGNKIDIQEIKFEGVHSARLAQNGPR